MTVDPRVEAAAYAIRPFRNGLAGNYERQMATAALAAADAVERPVAQRLADALRLILSATFPGAFTGVFPDGSPVGRARAVLAEWDATQEPT